MKMCGILHFRNLIFLTESVPERKNLCLKFQKKIWEWHSDRTPTAGDRDPVLHQARARASAPVAPNAETQTVMLRGVPFV